MILLREFNFEGLSEVKNELTANRKEAVRKAAAVAEKDGKRGLSELKIEGDQFLFKALGVSDLLEGNIDNGSHAHRFAARLRDASALGFTISSRDSTISSRELLNRVPRLGYMASVFRLSGY
jgi:hypothetical protein